MNQADGTQTLQVQHLYANLFSNLIVGKTDSFFSDPNSVPVTVDLAGPNAQIYAQHAVLGYMVPFFQTETHSLYAVVAAEQAETSITAAKTVVMPDSFAVIPDFTGQIHWNETWGHVQLAGVVRSLNFENGPLTIKQEVYGGGVDFSGAVKPFPCALLKNDLVSWGVVYGQGIGNYILDLRAATGCDAALDARNDLHALIASSYFIGYAHTWAPGLRTAVVLSEVDLSSIVDQGSSAYRRGRYAAINTTYQWQVKLPGDKTPARRHRLTHQGRPGWLRRRQTMPLPVRRRRQHPAPDRITASSAWSTCMGSGKRLATEEIWISVSSSQLG